MTPQSLGLRKYVALYSIRGHSSPEEGLELVRQVIHWIGMDTADLEPVVWIYPVGHKGEMKGGLGFTLVQPITESVTYQDYWEDHGGYYLLIASCRRYSAGKLARRLKRLLKYRGETLLGYDTCRGSLTKWRPWWRFW